MADAISGTIVQTAVEEPLSQAYREINSIFLDFKCNLESLQNSGAIIEAVLYDVDSAGHRLSQAEQVTVDKMRCQLDRLRDFFDLKESRALRKQVMGGNRLIEEARLFFSSFNQLFVRFKDARKIKDIRKQLDSITRDHAQFGSIVSVQPSCSPAQVMSIQTTTCHILNDVMVGRSKQKNAILSKTCDDSVATETLSVSAVTGIGGIGKTMLARHVYNDAMVKRRFDVRFWVDVTQGFDVTKMLQKIASSYSIQHFGSTEYDRESLILDKENTSQCYDHFLQAIVGKKFLLVLDNIWDQPDLRLKWLQLRRLLEFGAHGSKVLITTRDKRVAGMMDSHAPFTLADFTESESWLLFQQIAFTQWQEPGVKEIGQEIIKMCPKVPLVIQSVAGVLAGKSTMQEWQAFRDDQFTNFASYGRDIMGTLKLSYDQLDTNLKLCVLFCSLFRKGFEFQKMVLIGLWIGLGYVVPKYINQSLEEAGEEYLISLLNSGFFYKRENTAILVMHDVMHDLSTSLAGSRYKMADSNTHEFHKGVRHVSIVSKSMNQGRWEEPSSLFKIKHLESFIIILKTLIVTNNSRYAIKMSRCDKLISRFIFLKVLMLKYLPIKNLPNSIGELLSLRYLYLSRTALVKLPNCITRLVNLLSLVLDDCYLLQEWPRDMSTLVKLRHLIILGCPKLTYMPTGLGKLVDLRIINRFIVSEQSSHSESEYNEVGRLRDLNGLNHITGDMCIEVRKASRDTVADAKESNLMMKGKLTRLRIDFCCSTKEDEMVLEVLQPHSNIREMEVSNYGGESLPKWMMDNQLHCWLPNLVSITIKNCKSCKHLCFLGRLPHLSDVSFHNLDEVEYIYSSDSVVEGGLHHDPLFPSLESLSVIQVPNFKGWWKMSPSSIQDSSQLPNHLVEWKPSYPKLKTLSVTTLEVAITFGQSLSNGCTSLNALRICYSMMVGSSSYKRQPLVHLNNFFPYLRSVTISGVDDDLVVLPEEFQGLSSLEELIICMCDEFKAIPDWIDSLISLGTLHILACSKFESLPRQISNIPTLKSLVIVYCLSSLKERCRKPTGEFWPYIQHIPHVLISSPNP